MLVSLAVWSSIVEGFSPVFLVHIASALVYKFPQASELQCLSVLLRHPWFHYQKCIIIIIIIINVNGLIFRT